MKRWAYVLTLSWGGSTATRIGSVSRPVGFSRAQLISELRAETVDEALASGAHESIRSAAIIFLSLEPDALA